MCNDQIVSRVARRSFATQEIFGWAFGRLECCGENGQIRFMDIRAEVEGQGRCIAFGGD